MTTLFISKTWIVVGLLIICATSLVVDFLHARHTFLHAETMRGFYPLAGFVIGVGVVVAAAILSKLLVCKGGSCDD